LEDNTSVSGIKKAPVWKHRDLLVKALISSYVILRSFSVVNMLKCGYLHLLFRESNISGVPGISLFNPYHFRGIF